MTAVSEPPARKPETADLARLVQTHQANLWRYARYLGAENAEADDLVQETFLALVRSDFVERSEGRTASYLRTTTRNQLLMLRRRQKRQLEVADLDAAEQVWAETFSDTNEDPYLDALCDCVGELDGRAKQAIDLHYHQKASRKEIANQLNMKPEGVKTLLRRTRDALRTCIERRVHVNEDGNTNRR
ncbi:MAG: RNA polymerase sigma factor [Aeoliella sp.]